MRKTAQRFTLRTLPILYITIIWLQSSYFNPESIYILSSHIRIEILLLAGVGFELFHLFQFGILYFLLIMGFLTFGKLTRNLEWIAAIISISYGLIDEIHQMYVPFRSFSIMDLIKDTIGVLIMAYIINRSYFKARYPKIRSLLRKVEGDSENAKELS